MRARVPAGVALLIGVLALVFPGAAHATDPVSFDERHIVDTVNALGGREGEVQNALDELFTEARIDLYLVYTDRFTGAANREQWADETADANGLGTNDVLLAVATDDREYQLSVALDSTLTNEQLGEIETIAIEPALRENDWAGAGIGAASGLAASVTGAAVTTGEITPGEANPGGSGGGPGVVGIILLVVGSTLVLAAIVFILIRRARRKVAAATASRLELTTLKQDAGRALVHTDDAIKTSEEELGFATAQFGAESTRIFDTALSAAQKTLSEAFTLQQRLDDAEPDTDEQRRAWYCEIVQLCATANEALDAQADAFDELRELEKRAPEAAASVAQKIVVQRERMARAAEQLRSLGENFTPAALATIADNPDQAEDRLVFAANALEEANTRIAAAELGAAAVGIRAAEEATDQAGLLLDAIDRLGTDLHRAAGAVDAAAADLRSDLATMRGLTSDPTAGAAGAALPGLIESTQNTLEALDSARSAGPTNPLELIAKLEYINAQVDAALQGVREATIAAQRAQAALDQTMLAARSQVSATTDFVTARRGAVGAEARTRLAEAGRFIALAEATAATDPAAALRDAQRANSLATDALAFAQNDVHGFSVSSDGGLGELFGSGRNSGGQGSMGAVLGGILIGTLLSGGGSPFGGGGGRRGGGFGGGSRSPGSFGGGGTRSRRGGGGRF